MEGLTAHVRNAVLPGGLHFGLDLEFRFIADGWRVLVTWRLPTAGDRKSTPLRFNDLIGGAPLETTFTGASLAGLVATNLGKGVKPPTSAILSLSDDGRIGLRATAGRFAMVGGRVRVGSLLLAPAPPAASNWRASAQDRPGASVLKLGMRRGVAALLVIGAETQLSIEATDKPIVLRDALKIAFKGPATPDRPLPLGTASIACEGSKLALTLVPRGGIWNFDTRQGTFGVSGEDDPASGGRGKTFFHGDLASRAGRILAFSLPLRLFSHNLKVEGTDWSRLDIGGTRFDLRLVGDNNNARAGMVIGDATSEPLIDLDCASLRISRGRDLLSLKFRFRDADLRLGAGLPVLEPRKLAGNASPLMVVDFPPQHVMERAYLRQAIPLPDAGDAPTPEEVRRLRLRDSATKLRRDLFDAKKTAEENDPLAMGTPFADFAVVWNADAGIDASEKPYIGPDGLLTVKARQRARALAREARDRKLSAAVDALKQTPATQAAIDAVAPLVPLPPIPLAEADVKLVVEGEHAADGPVAVLTELMRLAARRNADYADLQASWELYRREEPQASDKETFALATWPLLPQEWDKRNPALRGKLTFVSLDEAQSFFRWLLQRRKLATAEDADAERPDLTPEGFVFPTEARLAGPSRLAFEIRQRKIRFDAEHLTRWDDFDLKVVKRAARFFDKHDPKKLEGKLETILSEQGLKPNSTVEARFEQIYVGSIAPDIFETALELPARLVLSPTQDARWITPGANRLPTFWPGPADVPNFVWQARLVDDFAKTPSLRAVWSPDFRREVFRPPAFAGQPKQAPQPGPWAPWDNARRTRFRTALDAADRHELVILSSVPGLPIIGVPSSKKDSSQVAPPTGYALTGIEEQNALYLPKAMPARRMFLGSLGATLDLDNRFEPPVAARWSDKDRTGAKLFETMSVERWRSLIVDGRDVVTTIVRRGYLFPLGHRAALVRTTEPRIRPLSFSNPKLGYVVEEAQRLYVEATVDPLVYPAAGQPNAGRGWQARSIKLVTLRTPDLIDPTEDPPRDTGEPDRPLQTTSRGNVQGSILAAPAVLPPAKSSTRALTGLVFWPRTEVGEAGTVRFRMQLDSVETPVSMPLLFVDNKAANDEETLAALCTRYYEQNAKDSGKPVDYSRLNHGGAPRAYADELKPGDCSFLTDWQDIGVEGRASAKPFAFDGALQSAGQPPFYPRLLKAQIRSQQIQGLTGVGSKPMRVCYPHRYVRQGFGGNVAEQTFLEVVDAVQPTLDMGNKGDRGGGVGRPALLVAGFNRQLGPIGRSHAEASDSPKILQNKLEEGRQVASGTSPAPEKPSGFAQDFFSDDAKLLGLIGFRDLIGALSAAAGDKALPILQEVTEFKLGVGQVEALFAQVDDITRAIQVELDAHGIGRDILPDLVDALGELNGASKEAKAAGPAVLDQAPALAKMWAAGQRLVGALEAIAKEPLGPLAEKIRLSLARFATGFADEVARFDPAAAVREELSARFSVALSKEPWSSLFISLPGLEAGATTVVARALHAAVGDKAVWMADKPLEAIAERVRNDAGVAKLEARVLEKLVTQAFQGPLFAEISGMLNRLRDLRSRTILTGASALVALIVEVRTFSERVVVLQKLRPDVCRSGARALTDLIDAVLPDLGLCDASFFGTRLVGSAACDLLKTNGGAIGAAAVAMRASAHGDVAALPFIRFADGLAKRFADASTQFSAVLAALAKAKSDLSTALGSPNVCEKVDSGLPAILTRLFEERARLAEIAFDVSLPELKVSGHPPANLKVQWNAIASAYAATAASLLGLALNTSFAGARLGAQRKDLTHAVDLLNGGAKLPDEAVVATSALLQPIETRADAVQTKLEGLAGSTSGDVVDLVTRIAAQAKDLTLILEDARSAESSLLRTALRVALAKVLPTKELIGLWQGLTEAGASKAGNLYAAIVSARASAIAAAEPFNDIAAVFFGSPGSRPNCRAVWTDSLLLIPDDAGNCTQKHDILTVEAGVAGKPDRFEMLVADWSKGQAAPLKIIRQITEFGQHGARAQIVRLLDVEALRDRLIEKLRELTPFRKRLSNDLSLPLTEISVGGFAKLTPLADKSALELNTAVDLYFDPPSVTEAFTGRVPRFSLDVTEVIKVTFNRGITYKGGSGQQGHLEAELSSNDIEFGDTLKFLEELKDSLSIGGGGGGGNNGPFVNIGLIDPQIEAGYRIAIPAITLGITFTNINFIGKIVLPFSNKEARVGFALGSLQSPFMISAGIYGGSGFFGLEASARGIEVFEASFEFGGIAALAFGPLSGVAYVTTGVYVRKDGHGCTLSGLFSAGFSAHIACFAICATFTLRIQQPKGGASMEGEATLTFSFRVAFAHIDYHVNVKRSIGKGFDNASSPASGRLDTPSIMVADASGNAVLEASDPRCQDEKASKARLISIGASADRAWGRHVRQFDGGFRPKKRVVR